MTRTRRAGALSPRAPVFSLELNTPRRHIISGSVVPYGEDQ
jgi:hypothetical protein